MISKSCQNAASGQRSQRKEQKIKKKTKNKKDYVAIGKIYLKKTAALCLKFRRKTK